MSWLEGSRARLRLLFGRRAAESRMTWRSASTSRWRRIAWCASRDWMPSRPARALVAFGGVERHKEELRDGRGRAWFDGLSLDLKLGGRML